MSGGGSVYSPLPQSNSDSDEFTEEELHSSGERQRVISQISKFQKHTRSELALNGKKNRITNYKQLDNDRDIGITLNGFQLSTDEITVLKPNNKIDKLSTSRKICFTLSLFLCIFTTVIFLWILPCEIGSCPPVSPQVGVNSWKKTLFDLELQGPINVVHNAKDKNQNLIFLYRNSLSEETGKGNVPAETGGIISLLGVNGEISWKLMLKREPKDLDCNVIDIDLDGIKDCLVVGKNNLLKAVQPLSGINLWDIHSNNEGDTKPCDLNFPIILPDIDGDHVSDLLTTCSVGVQHRVSKSQNYFVLISGRTGTILGKLKEITSCSSVRNFMIEKEFLVSFTCLDSMKKESVKTVPLIDIISEIESSLVKKLNFDLPEPVKEQHKISPEGKIFDVDGRRLNMENRGHCPDHCNLTVTIKDERNERKNQTVWTFNRSYGMVPITIKFGKVTGFIFKYWQWHFNKEESAEKYRFPNSSKLETNLFPLETNKFKRTIHGLEQSETLESDLYLEPSSEFRRYKRMLKKRFTNDTKIVRQSSMKQDNYTLHHVTERTVLITFNETDSHIVNTSQFEIIQICSSRVFCQPNVLFQKHSLLITDLDNDNLQELVSFCSSYVNQLEQNPAVDGNSWQLQSKVQIIRLEAEIPKLYDSKNN